MIYSTVAFNIFEIVWAKGIWITLGGLLLAGLSLIGILFLKKIKELCLKEPKKVFCIVFKEKNSMNYFH